MDVLFVLQSCLTLNQLVANIISLIKLISSPDMCSVLEMGIFATNDLNKIQVSLWFKINIKGPTHILECKFNVGLHF